WNYVNLEFPALAGKSWLRNQFGRNAFASERAVCDGLAQVPPVVRHRRLPLRIIARPRVNDDFEQPRVDLDIIHWRPQTLVPRQFCVLHDLQVTPCLTPDRLAPLIRLVALDLCLTHRAHSGFLHRFRRHLSYVIHHSSILVSAVRAFLTYQRFHVLCNDTRSAYIDTSIFNYVRFSTLR